jgi:CRISPR/Cas system-associated exonuclease Cas4 (RecB family)
MNKNPLERHMVPLELNASDFEIKKLMTFTAIHNLLKKRGSIILTGKLPRCEAEKWLETSDGKIGGRIDLIKHTKLGIEILDYKTGPIIDPLSEDSSPELKYQQQLKLSAAIYYDAEKKWPSKLVILGLDQKEYIINFSEKECLQILDAAKRDLEEINQRILAGENPKEFANPSPESCKYCVYRPACSAYWNQREDNIHWPNDFMGYIKEKKILGNGLFRVILDNSIKKIAIRGLSTNRHGFLKNNIKSVMFCNLRRDQAEEDYTEDMLTVGYSI